MRRIGLLTAFLMVLSIGASYSQSNDFFIEPYTLGSQTFTMSAGLFWPLFFHGPGVDGGIQAGMDQLSLGGMGSLAWSGYLTSRFSLGVELAGAFTFSPAQNTQGIIPVTGNISYLFRRSSFDFPVSLGVGVVFNRHSEQLYFGPFLRPGASVFWNMNAEWAFGFNLRYWWVPEIYFGDNKDRTAFGNYLESSLSARYSF